MSRLAASFFLAFAFLSVVVQAQSLTLGNEPWPPFVLEGEEQGTAEAIVCEALDRAGYGCSVEYGPWDDMLTAAAAGTIDGVAAIWFTQERGRDLVFSAAYLTNRLVPVTVKGGPLIRQVSDLQGRNVALEVSVAYGGELLAAQESFNVVPVRGAENGLRALRNQEAEVAIVDELFARELLKADVNRDLVIGETALAYRDLHLAVSRENPAAQEVIAGFNQAYRLMLRDGTINRILDIEWVATDLGDDGVMDFIHRGDGLNEAIRDAAAGGSVYAMGQDEYNAIREPGFVGSNARYLSDEKEYETPEAAMNALDGDKRCRYESLSARIVCSGR